MKLAYIIWFATAILVWLGLGDSIEQTLIAGGIGCLGFFLGLLVGFISESFQRANAIASRGLSAKPMRR
jgi:hypothetical protein